MLATFVQVPETFPSTTNKRLAELCVECIAKHLERVKLKHVKPEVRTRILDAAIAARLVTEKNLGDLLAHYRDRHALSLSGLYNLPDAAFKAIPLRCPNLTSLNLWCVH